VTLQIVASLTGGSIDVIYDHYMFLEEATAFLNDQKIKAFTNPGFLIGGDREG
jgi:hypothetical protein